MKYFTAFLSALALRVAISAPLQTRDVKVGALNTILSAMNSTLTQDQATSNQLISQMKAGTAAEIALAQQMAIVVAQIRSDIQSSGDQIASSLQNTAISLVVPDIVILTQSLKQAAALAKSIMMTFQTQANVATALFSAQASTTMQSEIIAAEAALYPFLSPMIAFAMAAQSDGSSQATASMAALSGAVTQCVAIVTGLNQILGISTSRT